MKKLVRVFVQYLFWYKLPKLNPNNEIIDQNKPIKEELELSNFEKTTKPTPINPIINPNQTLLFIFSSKNFKAKKVTIIGCSAIIKAFVAPAIP